MAKMTRKCQRCKIDDTHKDEMAVEFVGEKKIRKHYHKECYEKHLKEKAFREKEAKELDDLRLTIEKIYGLTKNPLPKSAYPFLQKLRNGEQIFGNQKMGKRYKEGYSYPLIQETFEHIEDTIHYWNSVKNFNGFMNAFKYALSILIDKIYIVEQRATKREQQDKMIEAHLKNIKQNDNEQIYETNYKKPAKTQADITDFLDD